LSTQTFRAPAKLNLGLRITGRRPDGYHLLESLFVPLDLADRLEIAIEASPAGVVELSLAGAAPDVPADDRNLAVRAARMFLDRVRKGSKVLIKLEKVVPSGAGLGGGSSDAAAVLRALDNHFANALSKTELAGLALRLGADVPFFLDPRPAWVTGIGEQVEPVAELPALDVVLVTPAPPLATSEVFRAYDAALTPSGPGRRMPPLRDGPGRILIAALANEKADQVGFGAGSEARTALAALLTNDLASAASSLHPEIERVSRELERLGAVAVAMSGSGPTVYGLFPSSKRAMQASTRGSFEKTDRVLTARTQGATVESSGAGSQGS
jgi:4-diphosphocytidyl-2-C-methyl-D-erythritol kinase